MKFPINTVYKRIIAPLMIGLTLIAGMSSCSAVYDDLEECPRGVIMRFVFDYNLEFANAFPSQVDCLTVYLFDKDGDLIERCVETSSVLADEDWRMTFDLPAGDYTAVAYGGMECEKASFNHTKDVENIKRIEDLEVLVNEEHIGDSDNAPTAPLHDHFHGKLNFTVTEGIDYERETLRLMRNTNNLHIVLQHVDNSPVDYDDFEIEVLDDNIYFNHANDVQSHHQVRYTPWRGGNLIAGASGTENVDGDDTKAAGMPVQVAFAELSMSRLVYRKADLSRVSGDEVQGPTLRIKRKADGHVVADLPLNNYLLLMKSGHYDNMGAQEYLDRSYHHNLVFFLDSNNNVWLGMHIIVDDWTVRIDNINL